MGKRTKSSGSGWRHERNEPTLAESYKSMPVPTKGSRFRKFLAFVGPGYMVAVGYMDPGNWATDIAGGSRGCRRSPGLPERSSPC
ncbi:hypothetical protein NDS46_24210 [Paenibacillus thiaminolyticus]|nr:hypothetical protein [Paenibacillus thiaminolyticus]WCF07392.1 hypothetical protein NDS46_24210 [Paenibacillus thiaminolyticus]